MLDESTAGQGKPPSRTPRSPIEKALVRGLILVLLTLVAAEAQAEFRFARAYRNLAKNLRRADDATYSVTERDVRSACGMEPVRTLPIHGLLRTADREDTYAWKGLIKTRRMYVYYGAGPAPEVLFVTTLREPTPAPVRLRRGVSGPELAFPANRSEVPDSKSAGSPR